MPLLFKELIYLKSQRSKVLLLLCIETAIIFYLFYNNSANPLHPIFSVFITSFIFIYQMIFSSIQSEKINKAFDRIFQLYSLREIIFNKCFFYSVIGNIIGVIYGASAIIYQRYINVYVNYKMFILAVILAFFINFIISLIFSIIIIIINQLILLNIISFGLVIGSITVILSLNSLSDVELVKYLSITIVGILAAAGLIYLLMRYITNEYIINKM